MQHSHPPINPSDTSHVFLHNITTAPNANITTLRSAGTFGGRELGSFAIEPPSAVFGQLLEHTYHLEARDMVYRSLMYIFGQAPPAAVTLMKLQ